MNKSLYRTTMLCNSILLLSISTAALALQPIPKKTGVSGFINLGAMGVSVESNLLAETPFNDLGEARIDSLNEGPDSKSSVVPVLAFELSYTWAESRTQIFIGNRLEDFLRFDFSTVAGIRQGVGKVGIFALEAISTPIETKVWADPYVTGIERQTTARTADGARIVWDKIFNSDLEIRYSSREVELDNELSGTGLGLTSAQRALLSREGDTNRLDISYLFKPNDKNLIIPRISYIDYDRDGRAMANDGVQLELSYLFKGATRKYVANVLYGKFEFDEINPAFGIKNEADHFGATFTMFWNDAFGLKGWTGNAGIVWFENDNDIDFYDSNVIGVSFGMLHRF